MLTMSLSFECKLIHVIGNNVPKNTINDIIPIPQRYECAREMDIHMLRIMLVMYEAIVNEFVNFLQ